MGQTGHRRVFRTLRAFRHQPVVAELATTGRIDIGSFYTRRALRILPLLFAALLFALTVMSWLYAPINRAPIDRATFASTSSMVAFCANNIGFAQRALHYFSAGENPLLQRGLRPRYGSTDNHTLSPTTDHWLLPSVIGLPS